MYYIECTAVIYLFNLLLVIYLGFRRKAEVDPDWIPSKRHATPATSSEYRRKLRKAAQRGELASDTHINVKIMWKKIP